MEPKNMNVVTCPPCGESTLKGGKGVVNKDTLMDTPPSALRATSPAGGEVNGGFTLIELLVVVLIIGILAAVAVPQYQFAVDKSRVISYVEKAQEIIKAEQVYYLANGSYTRDLRNLDIDLTKICPTLNSKGNELYDCPHGFGFNLRADDPSLLDLMYCPNELRCNSGAGTKEIWLRFNVKTREMYSCTSKSARGERLCKYFSN